MEKILIEKQVLNKTNPSYPIFWKDIKDFKFEDNDVIQAGFQEPFYNSDSASDGYYYLTVHRNVLETDEEYEKRKNRIASEVEEMKKRRYETYLKLKKEFEK